MSIRLALTAPTCGYWNVSFKTRTVSTDAGLLEVRVSRIATHYVRGFFFVDIISSIPFDLIFESSAESRATQVGYCCRRDIAITLTRQIWSTVSLFNEIICICIIRV